jgi:hypothetical protein
MTCSITQSFTGTMTQTVTVTYTQTTTQPPTQTLTVQPLATFTVTAIATPESEALKIDNLGVFPNPYTGAYGGPMKIRFDVTQDLVRIKVKIYTSAYRLAFEETKTGFFSAGCVVIQADTKRLSRLGAGTYYFTVYAESTAGKTIKSRISIISILR